VRPRLIIISFLTGALTYSSIIAIHGLGANPNTTWVSTTNAEDGTVKKVNWPKDSDMLPSLIPHARIWAFCYDSRWLGEAPIQQLDSLGDHLLILIHQNRPSQDDRQKPIVFIAHSFGGIVLEAALTSTAIEQYRHILKASTGAIFLGTPFRGSPSVQQARLIADAAKVLGYGSSKTLLDSLLPTSEKMANLLSAFTKTAVVENLRIVCFFEQLKTTVLRNMGLLSRATKQIIVPKAQAILDVHQAVGLGTSHTEMNEFSGPDDNNYKLVAGQICETAACSLSIIQDKSKPQTETAKLLLPYLRNPNFVGRTSIIQKLDMLLTSGQRCAALYGLGGIGKSQIAIEYAYSTLKPNRAVFWVHAASRARFEQSFLEVACVIGLQVQTGNTRESMLQVKRWLESNSGDWLLIIDNADDGELFSSRSSSESQTLSEFIPHSRSGSILFTSRDRSICIDLVGPRSIIRIDEMDMDECKKLLQNSLSDEMYHAADITPLIQALYYIPLALSQAAAFMERNFKSASDYMKLLLAEKDSEAELLSQDFEATGRDRDSFNAITKTWRISFEQINKRRPLSTQLLSIMAYFDKQAIPKELLLKSHSMSQVEFESALGTLQAFSMITPGTSADCYDIHRLVQVCTRDWLKRSSMAEEVLSHAVKIMVHAYPMTSHEDWQKCAPYLPHAQAVLEFAQSLELQTHDRGTLLNKIGCYVLFQGEYAKAESYFKKQIQLYQKSLGQDHPYTLASISNLAEAYRDQGRWDEAETIQVELVETKKRVLGPEHLETLIGMYNLAATYINQGRWDEAAKLYSEKLDISYRTLGAEHPSTLVCLGSIAMTYKIQERWDEVEKLEVQVMELSKKVFGAEHPATLTSISNLGITYSMQGKDKDAELLKLESMELRKRVLGPEHPDTLNGMSNLALTYMNQERCDEAEKLLHQVIEIRTRVLGAEHPNTVNSMWNLAHTYRRQSRNDKAISLLRQVVSLRRKVLRPDHPDLQQSSEELEGWPKYMI
jgi:tetratricopeptide (TPR) repeat protein